MIRILRVLSFFVLLFVVGCNETQLFTTSIGKKLSDPTSIAVDTAKLRAYVVNSNNDVQFTSTTLSILDITNPVAPALLNVSQNPIPIASFSGQIYYDPATGIAYVANRKSDDINDVTDTLLRINLNETSGSFGGVTGTASDDNPFGVTCCDATGRMYVVNSGGTSNGSLDVYDPKDLTSFVRVSLNVTLNSGSQLTGKNSTESVLLGTQDFVSNRGGSIYVINTSEVGDSSKNPVDYVITGVGDARGVATDGTFIYVVDASVLNPILRVLKVSLLPPVTPDVSTIQEVDVNTVLSATIALEKDPNEVTVFNGTAYVTNRNSNTVSVINLANNTLTTTIAVGKEPFAMKAFTVGTASTLYVSNLGDDSISIIDLSTNAVVATFSP